MTASRVAGVFEAHLSAALALNRARAPVYERLSRGSSRSISRTLIGAEQLLIPIAWWFDQRGAHWARAGIPLLEEIFVPLDPVYASPLQGEPAPGELVSIERLRRELRNASGTRHLEGITAIVEREHELLALHPGVNCMVRHLLESIRAITVLLPHQEASAQHAGMPSPAPLQWRLLRWHILGLPLAARLDRLALPLQRDGIRILAADLPEIPIPDITH